MNSMQHLTRLMVAMVSVLLMGAAFVGFVPQIRKYHSHDERLRELRADTAREELRLQELRVRQDRFQNDRDYVKKVAHEIGMVEPHEMVFRFYEDDRRSR
jgi:cell division protein FtsB